MSDQTPDQTPDRPETFDVIQFLADGSREKVRERVCAEEAVRAAHHYCTCVGAQLGIVRRVLIVDRDDFANFEWLFGEGVTYPEIKPEAVH